VVSYIGMGLSTDLTSHDALLLIVAKTAIAIFLTKNNGGFAK